MALLVADRWLYKPLAGILTGVHHGVLRKGEKELLCPGCAEKCDGRHEALYRLKLGI